MADQDRPTPPCQFCVAAWGQETAEAVCQDHDERVQSVARQIAERIHGPTPTDEQIGWFMEDGQIVVASIPEGELTVTRYEDRTMRMTVSGHQFRVDDEGGLTYIRGPK